MQETVLRSCFEFLQKVFLGLMYPFSCVLWAIFWPLPLLFFVRFRQIARYLPHHRSENASKTHPKSSHDKFKTASEFILCWEKFKTVSSHILSSSYLSKDKLYNRLDKKIMSFPCKINNLTRNNLYIVATI